MRKLSLAAALIVSGSAWAVSGAFPSHPITMIVPFPPGASADTLARIVAAAMEPALGQPIVVENVSGAGGSIGTARVVHAAPDGYTLGIGNWSSHVGAPAISNVQYDVLKDLQPIAALASSPLWIVGKNSSPPRSVTELIIWVKTHPSTFATVGAGSGSHLCGLYFQQKTGAQFQYVPYRGGAPVMQDLMAEQIDLSCLEASQTLANVEAGRFKAFAVLGDARWPKAPDAPTMIESGIPGLTISLWFGLWTTEGTPMPIVGRLDAAVKSALDDAEVRTRLDRLGRIIAPPEQRTPAGLAAFHKAEVDKWWPIIKAAGIKAE
jgi:tripartite-type tricarboxylate transporter receptor subunit TctC